MKAFSEEWSERDVFPFLNVAGAPVVEENHAEDVILGGFDWDWGAVGVSRSDKESGLEFEVEFLGGGESGGGVVGWGYLPGRAVDIPVSGSDRTRSAMVPNRQMPPIRIQSIICTAKHGSNIGRML